ncbi:hypothetical protein CMI42_00225 [Candidatus Pacearchaeota archaeon]|nr:hypothetical protein [Candidatus Pacearchaeota archaeon]
MTNPNNPNEPTSLDDKKYQNPELKNVQVPQSPNPQESKEMQKVRENIENLKKHILKKYKFITGIGIIPPQAAEMFDEENNLNEEERKQKPMHLLVVLPDDKEKEFNNVKLEIIKKVKEDKLKVWLNIFLETDLWEICLDSKYNIIEAIGMSYPIHDKGILGSLRVAQIHKSLVLKKFEKYVYSYVIGGSLVRGEAIKTSDVDVYIIIDDTDVKRMPRLELKDKLRNIIHSYVMQAGELAGVKNKLSPQVYLLTEFWEGVKDANPIFYTFLRDGVPIYDRGGFLPWKLLLKMGKIKPTPESIDMFMGMGDKTKDMAKRRLLDIVIGDIYYGVLTPTQALLMLYGLPPTNPRETVEEVKRIFVDKEKLLDKKHWEILEEIVIKYFKAYEHGKVKEVTGKEVDKLMKGSEEYLKKLKEVRTELEKRMTEKTFKEIYENVFEILKNQFGKKAETSLVKEYEKEIVNKAKGNPKFIHTLNELINTKKNYKNKKAPSKYDFERLRKDSVYLVQELIEYGQRKDLGLLQKTKVVLTSKGKHHDLFLTKPAFLVEEKGVKKIEGGKIMNSDVNEMNKILSTYKGGRVVLQDEVLKALEKELGDFDVSF